MRTLESLKLKHKKPIHFGEIIFLSHFCTKSRRHNHKEMQEKIKGIVLRTVKYGENSIIIDMFTEGRGRMSFITTISHNKRSAMRNAFWQPLTMVEFSSDIHNTIKLPKPKEVSIYYKYRNIHSNPAKSTVMLFLAEFLSSALKGEEENPTLYSYIESSLQWFDSYEKPCPNFHLVFLMRLSRFIGIYPNLDKFSPNQHFDLVAGSYRLGQPSHPYFLRPEEARLLPLLFRMNYETMRLFRFSRRQRREILETLNTYYRIHLPGFPELKSLEILSEVFR